MAALVLAASCSSDGGSISSPSDDTPDMGTVNGRSGICGVADMTPQSACQSPADCPDETNYGPAACGNCPREALFQTCTAGACETYDRSGVIDARFVATRDAEAAQSYVAMILDPLMADGRRLDCGNLLNDCDVLDDPAVNVINVQIGQPVDTIEPDLAYTAIASAHVGEDRIVLIYVSRLRDGEGRIVAQGCTEGLTVTSGQTTQALVELVPYAR